ncbi:antibiotic biosynthesis monooxygenase [Streptomyces gilvifuscus]|uniref:Antibiotic biosynthesis monooxygenase n=1 Tax=Streptomyces gilvifuscus TaxID=1550617 RepID=A0ABT5FQW3_9ACTN|nr:antibiotic biosynthesis monooxygenase [Streptomyces gilvifuscus]MDC2954853.1 antibiotic biosynthesis monooxygenase [Streptomyces gilvifuscus]
MPRSVDPAPTAAQARSTPNPEENDVVVEHARLIVEAGREAEFQEVFGTARAVLAQADGFRWAELLRCAERPRAFLLLVGWESVEAHTVGFRGSERFARWRALVGPFFAEPPVVEHYHELGPRFSG